jgi:hypothetical protein
MAQKSNNISMRNFKKAVNYLKRNGEKNVGIIGGEPTLHPNFLDMMEYVIGKGLQVQLFTNGIMDRECSKELAPYDSKVLSILLNLNDKSTYTPKQLRRIESTCKNLNEKISLGYTIYTSDFSLAFHRDMISKYDLLKQLRIGIASPIAGPEKGDFFNTSDFARLGQLIIDNVEMLEKYNILIHFDCGFHMCLFTTEQLGILVEKSLGFRSVCDPIIDIDLNLNAHHCFPLTSLFDKPIRDYPDLNKLKQYYRKKFEGLKIFGNEGKCLTCKYLERNQCRGWCIGRILNSQDGLFEKVRTINDIEETGHADSI